MIWTIEPHKRARFITRINIAPSARLLYSEILMPGHKQYGHGELFEYDLYSSRVEARRSGGSELFTEKFLVEPHRTNVRRNGEMSRFDVFGNVVLTAPPETA